MTIGAATSHTDNARNSQDATIDAGHLTASLHRKLLGPSGWQSCTAPNETLASMDEGAAPLPHTVLPVCGG